MNILKKIVLFSIVFTSAFAINHPSPKYGTPLAMARDITLCLDDTELFLNLPDNWGIGETSLSRDSKSNVFYVYPRRGGHGSKIKITSHITKSSATNAMKDLKTSQFIDESYKDGFTVEESSGFYSCKALDNFLIEVWYTFPYKKTEHEKAWETLKDCISTKNSHDFFGKREPFKKPDEKIKIPSRFDFSTSRFGINSSDRIKFTHPTKDRQIVYKKDFFDRCTKNEGGKHKYDLKIDQGCTTIYMYIKWDTYKSGASLYKSHLTEISEDIKNMHHFQRLESEPDFYKGYAIWKGNPFVLVTYKGDGFLIGFAVKSMDEISLNELLERISYID